MLNLKIDFLFSSQEARQSALNSNGGPNIGNEHHQQSEPNIYVVNSSSISMDQPLSSVTTTTSVLPDVTGSNVDTSSNGNQKSSLGNAAASFDLWKMDSLMESGYINTYFRGGSNGNGGGSTNYPSLQAFPTSRDPSQTVVTATPGNGTSTNNMGPMSLLSLNISHNPKPTLTNSHSQTNLSALTSSQLPLQVFRYGFYFKENKIHSVG